jgi:pyridoxamine 5'-phosphate oxidase
MDKKDILSFISDNPIFALATSENNTPHVRFMMLYRADNSGLLFHTGESKDLHRQLGRSPMVEMCFYNPKEGIQVRISGTAELVEDMELKKQVVKDRPFMKAWVDSKGYDVLCIYRVTEGKACVWTMAANFAPKEYVQL